MQNLRAVLAWAAVVVLFQANIALAAADRNKIGEFLRTTGFDVALDSLQLTAQSAPVMLGLDKEDFGSEWTRVTDEIFDTSVMQDMALDILEQTLTPDILDHAMAFYASPLGQKLVVAENASHMETDIDVTREAGEAIISGLVQHGSPRLQSLKRMNAAIDGANASMRALQEVQVRFLMAAAGAGVIELRMDEADLRAFLASQSSDLRQTLVVSALAGSAYTYQAFSDTEVEAYATALEHPKMKRVYELMNAVQFEVMANRFEALAVAMSGLQPSTDL